MTAKRDGLSVSILKSLWSRGADGRWAISDLKGLTLNPMDGFTSGYFSFENKMELMTNQPSSNMVEFMASFGPTDTLIKQSIVPVVAWKKGDPSMRCVGTASIISCTGYIITAAHVLMDPYENGYGEAVKQGGSLAFQEGFNFGVLVPLGPGYGRRGGLFFPFEKFWVWGDWKESPMLHELDRFEFLTDLAVAKIAEMPEGAAHQPLTMWLNPFLAGETAYSIGYAEMADIGLSYVGEGLRIADFKAELYVSVGDVMGVFPRNHLEREVPTPGPCFDFSARIPGKMSGAPIFGADGMVVRGVVSRSFSGERHAFGAMLGPVMHLPLEEPGITGRTLETMMDSGDEGIVQVQGQGL